MERMTYAYNDIYLLKVREGEDEEYNKDCAINKLGIYETEEEEGLLVHLPCKKVYFVVDKGKETALVMSCDIEMLKIYEINRIDKGGIYWSTRDKAEESMNQDGR